MNAENARPRSDIREAGDQQAGETHSARLAQQTDAGPYAAAADIYWRHGWTNPLPVRGKKSPPRGFTGHDGKAVSWPDLQAWLSGPEGRLNVALRSQGSWVGIDVDAHDGKAGAATLGAAASALGPLPATISSSSRGAGQASRIYFLAVPPGTDLTGAETRFRKRFGDHIDILHRGHRYAVVWPSVHPETGAVYRWYGPDGEPLEQPPKLTDAGELPPAWLECLTAPAAAPASSGDVFSPPASNYPAADVDAVRARVDQLAAELADAPEGNGNNETARIGFMVGQYVGAGQLSLDEAERRLSPAFDGWTFRGDAPLRTLEATLRGALADGARQPRAWGAPAGEGPAATAPAAEVTQEPTWADLVLREAERLRLRHEAHELFNARQHARTWKPPADHGPLTAELTLPDNGPQWRLRGLLGAGHNAVLVAGRKAGKTTTVSNLIRSYVDGAPFLDRFEVQPTDAGVAVFNYEVDGAQYRRWLREVGIVNTDRVFLLHLRGRTVPLKDPRVRAWVTAWLRDRGIGLWIVDPYSRAYVGSLDNGNDEAQVGAFLDTLDVIKADAGVGELVMPVHTPKARAEAGEETAIGSQRLEGWPDSMWYLTRDLSTGLRFMRAEGRDVDVAEEQLTYDPTTRRLTMGGADRAGVRQAADVTTLVDHVRANPGCTVNDIKNGIGWGRDRVVRVRSQAGALIRTELGKNRSEHHYVVDLTWSGGPDRSGTPDQSGGLVSIETTTGPPPEPPHHPTTFSAPATLADTGCRACGQPIDPAAGDTHPGCDREGLAA